MNNATLSRAAAPRSTPVPELPGADILIRALEHAGVDTIFGLPGGAILPAYDPLHDATPIRHILVRHEQGAGHAASGYAQATGRVGVCMATSGPGATNLVTAIADAHLDSVPLVAITGQVPSGALGTDAFQEVDIFGITLPITKHSFQVTSVEDIAHTIAAAFHIAATGRPGPVLVDITKDALQDRAVFRWPRRPHLPGYRPVPPPDPGRIARAAQLIATARRPVLYVGGGVLKARATEQLRALVDLTGIPVTTTLMARGAFPDSDPRHLGMPGMHGTVVAVSALQRADLIIAVGTRFDDRVTGRLDTFAPHATVIHADIDAAEISKNRVADVPIVGDARQVLADLVTAVRDELTRGRPADRREWVRHLEDLRRRHPLEYPTPTGNVLVPQYVIERVGACAPEGTLFVSGVGQHQMWASQFIRHDRPHAWINSGGAGTMGFAVPAAMGVKAARPDAPVWAIDGDGCFQMTNQELATCVLNDLPIKVAVINNGTLGMVRQWQTLFYQRRYSGTRLRHHSGAGTRIPDFVLLAEALGCVGLRCARAGDVDQVLAEANQVTDRPVVVDFVVGDEALVWPMVAAGASNDDIMVAGEGGSHAQI